MSIRERIIRAGENNDPYNHSHNDAMLAAAREMALIIKERFDLMLTAPGIEHLEHGEAVANGVRAAHKMVDHLLAELSDGQTAGGDDRDAADL